MGENDSTLREAIGHDIERAIRLTNAAVAQLTQGERGAADPADGPDTDDEEDE